MRKFFIVQPIVIGVLCIFALSLPFPTVAETSRPRPDDTQERITARLEALLGQLCERIGVAIERGLPISLPAFCTPVPPPPPPPPVDVCPNVPGTQESEPCADTECVEEGGTWNGESCDMPPPSEGTIVITEIMYDPEGGDAGREWVEIKNESGASVDLTDWQLFEGSGNHNLTLVGGGSAILAPGDFAIIADNATTFLDEWTGFAGMLFDSAFSLSNTGETVGIKDRDGAIVDEVTYSSGQGGNNNGDSLQKTTDGWGAVVPTPESEATSSSS